MHVLVTIYVPYAATLFEGILKGKLMEQENTIPGGIQRLGRVGGTYGVYSR